MRKRSGSVTPAYSTDRQLLSSHYPGTQTVQTLGEAKTAVSKLAIYDDTTFKRRVTLETEADWSDFLESCRDVGNPTAFNLESLLKKCYTTAYSMPPSPTSLIRLKKSEESESPSALAI